MAVPLASLLAAACGGGGDGQPATVPPYFPLTVKRADARNVTFDTPPERIVSLSPGYTETLFAIGVGDQVVGVDKESDFPQAVKGKAKFDATSPDLGALEALKPDLVLVIAGPKEVIQAMDDRGLKVLWLKLPDSEMAILDQIDLLGQITGHLKQSDHLVDAIDSGYLAVLGKVGAAPGPRVYHEADSEYKTVSSATFTGELYGVLSASNIADQFPNASHLTLDGIVKADPEVIIVAHADASPELVKRRPGWQDISAVKNDRVFAVDPALVNRPGPRLVDGLKTLARLLYPDIFPGP